MKRKIFNTGFTLIELITATALVVIVILGIFSINMVLSNNNQDYAQRYLVRSATQTTLNHILNNAVLAVGSGTTDQWGNQDVGILIGPGGPAHWASVPNGGFQNDETICIHQAANNNLINSGSDIWLCYTWYPPLGNSNDYQIKYCVLPYASTATSGQLRGAANCNFANADGFTVTAGPTNLGTSNNDFMTNATFNTNGTNVGSTMLFTLTLQNCLNNAAASCNGGGAGISSDPVNNPEVSLTGSVTPTQEGMINSN